MASTSIVRLLLLLNSNCRVVLCVRKTVSEKKKCVVFLLSLFFSERFCSMDVAAETPPLVHPPTPAALVPARTALTTLADATYFRAALDPDTAASLFTACVDLPLDAARSGRGPRSHTYRGAEAALMPLPLAAAAAQLVAIGALKRPPTMISVNHYDDAIYEMVNNQSINLCYFSFSCGD
jgi:hypothetical protein